MEKTIDRKMLEAYTTIIKLGCHLQSNKEVFEKAIPEYRKNGISETVLKEISNMFERAQKK